MAEHPTYSSINVVAAPGRGVGFHAPGSDRAVRVRGGSPVTNAVVALEAGLAAFDALENVKTTASALADLKDPESDLLLSIATDVLEDLRKHLRIDVYSVHQPTTGGPTNG